VISTIFGASLAKIFDAVRGNVVKKRRSMLAARSLADQFRRFIEQPLKRGDVAETMASAACSNFEFANCVLQRFDVLRELRPARKSMRACNQELRVGELLISPIGCAIPRVGLIGANRVAHSRRATDRRRP